MKKKIIIIEDDTAVRENIYTLLIEEGFEAYSAKDGDEGISFARKYHPDLIICDVIMIGKTGYDVLEELRKSDRTKKIPFIFLTAKVEREDVRKGMRLGADDYLSKPFNTEELLNSIKLRFEKIELLLKERNKVEFDKKENDAKQLLIDDKIFIQSSGKPALVKIIDVLVITAENQYTMLRCKENRTLLVRKTITTWEKSLPKDNFLRIHRSTILNLNHIGKIEKWYNSSLLVYIKDIKEPFVVSKRYSTRLRKKIF